MPSEPPMAAPPMSVEPPVPSNIPPPV